ncbi:hypothetical protein [Streptomyces sp. DT117]|uniref:hypothetical protein n=1 Tax=Streptomyces sp. DT117 TaxID=3393422 RepID=UPI003CF2655C
MSVPSLYGSLVAAEHLPDHTERRTSKLDAAQRLRSWTGEPGSGSTWATGTLGGGWTATLVIDAIVTLVAASALAGIGVLISAFEENYDMPAGRHLSEAAPFLAGAALLVASLVVTALVVRSGPARTAGAGQAW